MARFEPERPGLKLTVEEFKTVSGSELTRMPGGAFIPQTWWGFAMETQSTQSTQNAMSVVICAGCLRPMRFVALEPAALPRLETATYHCDYCGAETKRAIRRTG